jgi:predicted nucleic acid-binding protein
MILVDTNILSTLAKVEKLDLLLQLFAQEEVGIPSAVYEEVYIGVEKGYGALQSVLDLIKLRRVHLIPLSEEEIVAKTALPRSFDEGKREMVAVAIDRPWPILTNEKLVKNWCQREGVRCLDLSAFLRALWRTGLRKKEEVRALIKEIEEKDRIIFKNKEHILADIPSE